MARSKRTGSRMLEAEPAALGPGLHLVTVELGTEGLAAVRTLDGRRLSAVIADTVHERLVAECRREGRPMIACDTGRGPTIVGALQTTPSLTREPDGTVVIEGPAVRIRAERQLTLEAGDAAAVSLEGTGKARLVGDRLVIDMSSNVRVLSALVELP